MAKGVGHGSGVFVAATLRNLSDAEAGLLDLTAGFGEADFPIERGGGEAHELLDMSFQCALRSAELLGELRDWDRSFDVAAHQSGGGADDAVGGEAKQWLGLGIALAIHEECGHFEREGGTVAGFDQVEHQFERRGGTAAACAGAINDETVFDNINFGEGLGQLSKNIPVRGRAMAVEEACAGEEPTAGVEADEQIEAPRGGTQGAGGGGRCVGEVVVTGHHKEIVTGSLFGEARRLDGEAAGRCHLPAGKAAILPVIEVLPREHVGRAQRFDRIGEAKIGETVKQKEGEGLLRCFLRSVHDHD